MEVYTNSNCSSLDQTTAYDFGSCLVTSDGKSFVCREFFWNGTAKISFYNNTGEGTDKPYLLLWADSDVCVPAKDGSIKVSLIYGTNTSSSSSASASGINVLNSRSNSTSGFDSSASGSIDLSNEAASSAGQGSAATTLDVGSKTSGISTGTIIGIVAAVIVVVFVVIGFLWHRRRSKKTDDWDTDKHGGGYAQVSSPTSGQKSADTGVTDFSSSIGLGPQSLAGLWDDEIIATSRIPREKILRQQLINRGGYGEVYYGLYNGQRVALKMLLPDLRKSVKHVNELLDEISVVMEYMEGGDLRALLVSYEAQGYEVGFDHSKVTIALHIAHALTYLHSLDPPVLHRDLKSKNILLTSDLQAKITDFGISRERADKTMTGGVGTSLWMAPEVMLGQRYDDKADVFSFGVVLSELDLHTLPYSHAKDNSNSDRKLPDTAILQMVALGKIRVEFSSGALESMVALVNSCVSLDPKERPTAVEVLYHLQTILRQDLSDE